LHIYHILRISLLFNYGNYYILKEPEMIFEIDSDTSLYYRTWEPSGGNSENAGNVIIVHGYAEHSGRYEYAGQYLSRKGFRVFAYDHPCHGQSAGSRALVSSIDDLVLKLEYFVKFVKKSDKLSVHAKTFMIGHSMGGVVSALYASGSGSEIDGLITSGAAVMPLPELKGLPKKLAEKASFFFPELGTIPLDPGKLSRDENVVKDYKSDPLNYNGKVKLKTAVELSGAVERIEKLAEKIIVPLLVLHGSDDRLADPEGSRLLFEKASSKDKQIRIFEGLRHEIFNEPEKDSVLETVREWIDLRLSR